MRDCWSRLPYSDVVGTLSRVASLYRFAGSALRLVKREMRSGSSADGLGVRTLGHVRRPPTGGSSSSNTVFAGIFCEATSLAAASAASLYMTPVCDFTLPMCVARPASSLTLMSSAVALIRSLWRWCLYLYGL